MLASIELVNSLEGDDIKLIVFAACGTVVALVAILLSMIKSIAIARSREATKREIAAYVAEGSIDPDRAIAILESDKPVWEQGRKPANHKN